MSTYSLPPLVGGFSDGKVTWQRIEAVDYDTLGYLLSCHLIIEHYLDHFLATGTEAELGWEGARLTFAQKVALISGLAFPDPYNLPPVIKHLNALRNRFAHNINMHLTDEDLIPIHQFLGKCIGSSGTEAEIPSAPKDVLSLFTSTVCAFFASTISFRAQANHD